MISEGLWQRRFGGDPSIVGRSLTLNGVDTTVVGIAPASLATALERRHVDPADDRSRLARSG